MIHDIMLNNSSNRNDYLKREDPEQILDEDKYKNSSYIPIIEGGKERGDVLTQKLEHLVSLCAKKEEWDKMDSTLHEKQRRAQFHMTTERREARAGGDI